MAKPQPQSTWLPRWRCNNQRTLLIDLDPQANSTLTFVNPGDVDGSIYDILTGDKKKLAEVVKPTRWMNLSLVPSRISLAKLEAQLVGQFDAPFRLKDAIASLPRMTLT